MRNGRRSKLLLLGAFGIIATLLACIQVLQYFQGRDTQRSLELIETKALVNTRVINRTAFDVQREQVLLAYHIFERAPREMAVLEHRLADLRADYVEAARVYTPDPMPSDEAMIWFQLQQDIAATQAQDDRILALSRVNRDGAAREAMMAAKTLFGVIEHRAAALVSLNHHAVERTAYQARAHHRRNDWIQRALVAGILLVVLLGGYAVTRSVVHAQDQLELKNRELDAFAGRVAHDLRNPLNTIRLASELVTVRVPDAARAAAAIERGVAKIARLIDDLLLLSRIGTTEQGAASTERIASSVEQDLLPLLGEAHGTLRVHLDPAEVLGNEQLLSHALWSLGENAVKYRRPDADPELEIEGHVEAGRYAIHVSDNGTGMFDDDARHAFEPFYRGKHVGAIPGTGLGLSIVQRIVQACGGRIALTTRPGVGTTFVIVLPKA
ncbi:MAG TPA: ATP-binding protein [Kofleriaceae bacterium]|nr:ATP-binding protein [Kofleriaceae bacterium]